MSMPASDVTPSANGATPPAKGPASAPGVNPPPAARRQRGSYAVAIGAIAVLAVLVIAMPRRAAVTTAPQASDLTPDAQEPSIERPIESASTGKTALRPQKPVAVRPAPPARAASPAQQDTRRTETPDDLVVDTRPRAGSLAIATASAPPARAAGTAAAPPVTITGCLEVSVDNENFRLTETEGAGAPKTRSWRTGFLTKRPAPIALVGDTHALGLQREVGKRVSVTGVQTSRELQVNSVHVVSASCD